MITSTTAAVSAAVNTDGAHVLVHFDYGTSTTYGASTLPQLLEPSAVASSPVSAALAGLPAGTEIHYRIVAQTDFGTVDGADATFITRATQAPGSPRVSHGSLSGVGKRKARLKFTVDAGQGAPDVQALRISLPAGLAFSKHKQKLIKGISIKPANGAPLSFRATQSHGALTITLTAPASEARVDIGRPAITVARHLARRVRHRKIKRLKVTVKVTDTGDNTTSFSLKLKAR
jgi:hypothetical protein